MTGRARIFGRASAFVLRRGLAVTILASVLAAPALVAPAAAIEFRAMPDRAIVGEIEAALLAYREANKRWPAGRGALERFARARGLALDLAKFSVLTLTPKAADTVLVEYSVKPPNAGTGVFAVTIVEVR